FRRLKSLLLFINPTSGGGGSDALAKSLVLPWLTACGIQVVTIRTERRYHARDFLLRECLAKFDCVACVGGDGILSELVHGLLLRRRLDLGIDGHSKLDAEHPADMPIGVIPSGSTDAIVHSVNNNTDATTALVHILLGNRVAMDVTSVYDLHTGEFIAYNLGLLSYGYFGDICKGSESLRWLGPMRYDLMGALTLMRLPRHLLEVTLIETEPVRQPLSCHRRCQLCANPPSADIARQAVRDLGPAVSGHRVDPIRRQPVASLPSNGNAYAWRQSHRRYASVSSFTMPCRSAKSPHGAVPFAHLADGLADLVTVPGRDRLHFLHYLTRLTCRPAWMPKLIDEQQGGWEGVETQFQLDSVAVRRVSAFSVRILHRQQDDQPLSAWNSDGELLRAADIVCRVNPRLLTLFGSHIDE
uniref:DAGKc domain-containing protein n=1 Tax=Macrostomum lignano TaxID=282301 RepID=A0A1I8GHT1_9PLAT